MQLHTEITPPLDIDTMSKLVIHPRACEWDGCGAIINSWFTLQKVCEFLFLLCFFLVSI